MAVESSFFLSGCQRQEGQHRRMANRSAGLWHSFAWLLQHSYSIDFNSISIVFGRPFLIALWWRVEERHVHHCFRLSQTVLTSSTPYPSEANSTSTLERYCRFFQQPFNTYDHDGTNNCVPFSALICLNNLNPASLSLVGGHSWQLGVSNDKATSCAELTLEVWGHSVCRVLLHHKVVKECSQHFALGWMQGLYNFTERHWDQAQLHDWPSGKKHFASPNGAARPSWAPVPILRDLCGS